MWAYVTSLDLCGPEGAISACAISEYLYLELTFNGPIKIGKIVICNFDL
jgi:hypothetical protein